VSGLDQLALRDGEGDAQVVLAHQHGQRAAVRRYQLPGETKAQSISPAMGALISVQAM
jgi:hypothetical protein